LADYNPSRDRTGAGSRPPRLPGSLWIDNGRLANLVADYKASRVGDLVTISIAQNLVVDQHRKRATSRNFSASSGVTALPGLVEKLAGVANLFSPTSAQALTGKGQATSTTALTTTLTGRVVAVLPGGTLVIEAERQLLDGRSARDRDPARSGPSRRFGRHQHRDFKQRGRSGVEVKGKGVISREHPATEPGHEMDLADT